MGVLELWKKFIYENKDIEQAHTKLQKGTAFSHLIDLNGALYNAASEVFGIGDALNGTKLARRNDMNELRLAFENDTNAAHGRFFTKLREILTKNIIQTVGATDVLIIGIDGIVVRSKSVEQCNRRFSAAADRMKKDRSTLRSDYMEKQKFKFNTLLFTPGTPFMNKVCETVREWILINRTRLPTYVYFSDCSEEGEAEHKIFNIFQSLVSDLDSAFQEEYQKSADEIFKQHIHVVNGNDGDLLFISMLRTDYSFYWLRTQTHAYSRYAKDGPPDVVIIDNIRKFVIERMGGDPTNNENALRYVLDFLLLAFFIGDDFVPPMFTLTLDIEMTLKGLMDIYKENMEDRIIDEDGDINSTNFLMFLLNVKDFEKEMYENKKDIQEIEEEYKRVIRENEDRSKITAIRNGARKKFKRSGTNFEFCYSPVLENDFEEFLDMWPKVIICPAYMTDQLDENGNEMVPDKVMKFREIATANSDKTMKDICNSYLTGLKWNIHYYLGFDVNNWIYKWHLPPTIHHISDFLSDFYDEDSESVTYRFEDVEMKPGENRMDPTKSILTVMNMNLSRVVMNGILSGKNGEDTERSLNKPVVLKSLVSKVPYYTSYLPVGFSKFSNGRYYDTKYVEDHCTTIGVRFPSDMVYRLGVNKKIMNNFPENKSEQLNLDQIDFDVDLSKNKQLMTALISGKIINPAIGKEEPEEEIEEEPEEEHKSILKKDSKKSKKGSISFDDTKLESVHEIETREEIARDYKITQQKDNKPKTQKRETKKDNYNSKFSSMTIEPSSMNTYKEKQEKVPEIKQESEGRMGKRRPIRRKKEVSNYEI